MKHEKRLKLKNYLILLDSVPTPLLVLNLQHKIVARNKKFAEYFKKSGVLNKSADAVFSILKEDIIEDGSEFFTRIDEKYCHFSVKTIKIEDFTGFVVYILDRTEIIQDLNEKENKIKQLEDLIKVIFHDLRSPLSGIAGVLDLVCSDLTDINPENKILLISANKSSWALLKSLDGLIHWYSFLQNDYQSETTRIDLDYLIQEILELYKSFAEKKAISFISEKKNGFIISNRPILKSILENLISNAIKFSYEQAKISLQYEIKNTEIIFSVQDSGVGVPKEEIQKIFTLGFSKQGTLSENGTGFGLSIVQDFVKKLGGEIWVISKEGVGTTFKFRLPV